MGEEQAGKKTNQKLETILAQIGNRKDRANGAVNMPIYLATTYQHPGLGKSTGYDYTRTKNPTRDVLEEALAVLESGVQGFATSSGMSAIQLVFSLFPAQSHIVTCRDLYGGSFRYFKDLEEKGVFSFSYCEEEADFEKSITDQTVAFFIETPTNPLMNEFSISKIAKIAKAHGLLVIVDNTFFTPIIQRPLELGADIVVHSATKYLAGHNDILAGAVVTNSESLAEKLFYQFNTTGATLDPFDSWLLIRGLKTLSLRMEKHEKNAKEVLHYLKQEEQVREVFYPGKGGMISFKIKDEAKIGQFLAGLEIFTFAESLGGVESLITYPTTQTHADIPKEERESYGLTPDLLRLSIGIEDAGDLIQDLQQAFEK